MDFEYRNYGMSEYRLIHLQAPGLIASASDRQKIMLMLTCMQVGVNFYTVLNPDREKRLMGWLIGLICKAIDLASRIQNRITGEVEP